MALLWVVNKNNSQDLGGLVFLGLLTLIKWDDPGSNQTNPLDSAEGS
jgi:hypothetical protein